MDALIVALRLFGIFAIAIITGKLLSKIKLPAILGWLIVGVLFGPHLVGLIPSEIPYSLSYQIAIKFLECFAGVMIGKEINFVKLNSAGKQIFGITVIQSLGTFALVSTVFVIVFLITGTPIYLAFIFGGIALATAPAPALGIVHEYRTKGPVTKTLIPLAAIDDVIGVIVFFTVISIVSATQGGKGVSIWTILGTVLAPFVLGVGFGALAILLYKVVKNDVGRFVILVSFLLLSSASGILIDLLVYQSFTLNYLLTGIAFSGTLVNMVKEEDTAKPFHYYDPILQFSLIAVIINLGMPLDVRYIAGAGVFTLIYILSRVAGKIGFAMLGGKITKAETTVTKFLGFTLLPHSGVSLIFTGIAANTLMGINPELANIVQGTICAAAIINEIIAVILAKFAFKWAGELPIPNEN
ncbi:MAG: cation:proton antiporter [Candidatus Enteromonas sp.]|nr:cation:proton antiporter [Candidatus Enteromonas sp.]